MHSVLFVHNVNYNIDIISAQRSASYPLDQSSQPENGHKVDEKQSGSDEIRRPSMDDPKRISLRQKVLQAPAGNR